MTSWQRSRVQACRQVRTATCSLAGQAGLGVYERGDPWGSGYHQISYQRIDR